MARAVTTMVRAGQHGRISLSGPAKSGKTWTSLEWAQALEAVEVAAGRKGGILGIDTERGRMKLYADKFLQADGNPITHLDWSPPYNPAELAQEIDAWSDRVAVIDIDSLSHFWRGSGGVLDIVDNAGGKSAYTSGWKEATPIHDEMIEAILSARCHIIGTMRSKTDYVLEEDSRGHKVPKRVGLAPVQRDDVEYEFDVIATVDRDHNVEVIGTRCDLLDGQKFRKGRTVELAKTLGEWLSGAEPLISNKELDLLRAAVDKHGQHAIAARVALRERFGDPLQLRASKLDEVLTFLTEWALDDGGIQGTPEEIAAQAVRGNAEERPDPPPTAPHGAPKKTAAKKTGGRKPATKQAVKKSGTRKTTPKKAAAKRGGATGKGSGGKKTGKRASQKPKTVQEARRQATPAQGESWDEERTNTPGDPATAQNGPVDVSEGDAIRGQLANVLLQMDGPHGLQVEESFRELELWPIDEIPDDRVHAAADVMAPIAEAYAAENGADDGR